MLSQAERVSRALRLRCRAAVRAHHGFKEGGRSCVQTLLVPKHFQYAVTSLPSSRLGARAGGVTATRFQAALGSTSTDCFSHFLVAKRRLKHIWPRRIWVARHDLFFGSQVVYTWLPSHDFSNGRSAPNASSFLLSERELLGRRSAVALLGPSSLDAEPVAELQSTQGVNTINASKNPHPNKILQK